MSAGVIVVESKQYGGSLYTVGHAIEQNREVFAVPGPIGAAESVGTNRLIQEGAAKLIMDAEDVICELINRFPNRLKRRAPMDKETAEQRISEVTGKVIAGNKPQKIVASKEVDNTLAIEYIDWQDYKTKLTTDQQTVLLAIGDQKVRVDDLIEKTQIPARRVLSAITLLQLMGLIAEESGKRFSMTVRLKME